jgi:hypothetical protein
VQVGIGNLKRRLIKGAFGFSQFIFPIFLNMVVHYNHSVFEQASHKIVYYDLLSFEKCYEYDIVGLLQPFKLRLGGQL